MLSWQPPHSKISDPSRVEWHLFGWPTLPAEIINDDWEEFRSFPDLSSIFSKPLFSALITKLLEECRTWRSICWKTKEIKFGRRKVHIYSIMAITQLELPQTFGKLHEFTPFLRARRTKQATVILKWQAYFLSTVSKFFEYKLSILASGGSLLKTEFDQSGLANETK